MKKIYQTISITAVLTLLGCAHQANLSVEHLYSDPSFTGRKLSGSVIALCPLLVEEKPVQNGDLRSENLHKVLQKKRPDLQFMGSDGFKNSFVSTSRLSSLEKLYQMLFRSEVLALKQADSLWSSVQYPYILVYRLKTGAHINDLHENQSRRFCVVGELWSRENREPVWRSECRGITADPTVSDTRMLLESICLLTMQIPAVQPGFSEGEW